MNYSIRVIRLFFLLLCVAGSLLTALVVPEWDDNRFWIVLAGLLIGILVILVDVLLKGFSLRGLSALTFGLFVGWAVAHMLSTSPLFNFPEGGDLEVNALLEQNLYLARMALFVILMYLGAVLALRGKDEFNLVIPYVRFVPHGVDVPLAVVDTSALIDGRIVAICEAKFLGHALIVPRFVIDELHRIADSPDPQKRARGRRGLDALRRLREMSHLDLRISESSVEDRDRLEAKLVYLAQSLKAKILTTDFNLAQIAGFHQIEWLNITSLAKAMNPEAAPGDTLRLELVKPGKEPGQAVGYLHDGSMVVVNSGDAFLEEEVDVRVTSVLPSAGGKLIFAELEPH